MSYQTPNIIQIQNPVSLDELIQEIQADLQANLPWMEYAFGRAKPFTENNITEPRVFYGQTSASKEGEYRDVWPNDVWKSHCFFVTEGPETFEDYINVPNSRNVWTRPVSIIFWVDLHKIDPTQNTSSTEAFKLDVMRRLQRFPHVEVTGSVDNSAEEVFSGFNIDTTDNKNFAYPGVGFRIFVDMSGYASCETGIIPAPTLLIATTISSAQIDLTWVNNSGTPIQIERSLTSGSGFVLIFTTISGTAAYSDIGLDPSTQYFYRVRATDGTNFSAYSNEANDTTTASFSPSDLLLTLWLELKVLARTAWNTALKQLNNIGVGVGMDGALGSGVGLGFVAANSDKLSLGDQGNLKAFEMWVNLSSTTEKIIEFASGISIEATAGTLTATGWTTPTIKVNNVTTTTISTGWTHISVSSGTAINASATIVGLVGATYGDIEAKDLVFYDNGLGMSNYDTPQDLLAIADGVVYPVAEAEGADDPIAFNTSGYSAQGVYSTSAGSPYDPWIKGITVGFQTGLSNFNRYDYWDGTNDFLSLGNTVASNLSINSAWTLTVKSVYNGALGAIMSATNNVANDLWQLTQNSTKIGFTWNDGGGNGAIDVLLSGPGVSVGDFVTTVITSDGALNFSITVNGTSDTGTQNIGTPQAVQGARLANSMNNNLDYTGFIVSAEVTGLHKWTNPGGWVDEIGSEDGIVTGTFRHTQNIFGTAYNSTTDIFGNTITNIRPNGLGLNLVGKNHTGSDQGTPDTSGAFSWCIPVRLNSLAANQVVFSNRTSGTGNGISLIIDTSGNQVFALDDGSVTTLTSDSTLSVDTDYYVHGYMAADGNTRIGFATSAIAAWDSTETDLGTPEAGSSNMFLGAHPDGSDPSDGINKGEIYMTESQLTLSNDQSLIDYNEALIA